MSKMLLRRPLNSRLLKYSLMVVLEIAARDLLIFSESLGLKRPECLNTKRVY